VKSEKFAAAILKKQKTPNSYLLTPNFFLPLQQKQDRI
jgi:hypothetical protein